MCEAIIDLFRDEYDEGIAKEKQLGGLEKIISLFRKSLLSMADAPGELNVSIEVFEKMLNKEETSDNDTKSAG